MVTQSRSSPNTARSGFVHASVLALNQSVWLAAHCLAISNYNRLSVVARIQKYAVEGLRTCSSV